MITRRHCIPLLAALWAPVVAACGASTTGQQGDAGTSCVVTLENSCGKAPDAATAPYHDVTDTSLWSQFSLQGNDAFAGGAFDGRYVYYAPFGKAGTGDEHVARYDTQGGFGQASSWARFPLPGATPVLSALGAVFDGRYVYFVPNAIGPRWSVVRYDTHAGFTSASSWTVKDPKTLPSSSSGFTGGVFDGRYLYLVPSSSQSVVRYDTRASFEAAASWTSFDVSSLEGTLRTFAGGVFDGHYLYLVPGSTYATGPSPVIRYDTRSPFGSASSWASHDTRQIDPNAWGFFGGGFDGRYVYLVPYDSDTFVRFDTRSAFGAAASWSALSRGQTGYQGAGFDGRYVYFIPGIHGGGSLTRYDTSETDFGATSAWTDFDLSSVTSKNPSFVGAVFDGRYLYLMPEEGGGALRFDARSPPSMPKGYSGSFL